VKILPVLRTAFGLWLAVPALRVAAQTVVVTPQNAPAAPRLEDLPLQQSVEQHGITWTFAQPARVGRFLHGDWYVVGEVTVTDISPRPLFGKEVETDNTWTAVPRRDAEGRPVLNERRQPVYDYVAVDETERQEFGGASPRVKGEEKARLQANPNYCRNGSVLNLKPDHYKSGFDSRVRHGIYDPARTARLPIAMKPGDALVSTISKHRLVRSKHYGTTESVAVLTCLAAPVPADAFRPGYTDPEKTVYLARDLRREMLPRLPKPENTPDIAKYPPMFNRPWLTDTMFHETHAPYQFGGYGQGLARYGGDAACLLCLDFAPEDKEPLLLAYVQFGIDLYGLLKAGYSGWEAWGGWNSGCKHPIVFAGALFGDEKMARVSQTFPKVSFQEDEQTGYGRTWRGAPVEFLGHSGVAAATGEPRVRGRNTWGPYEHLHPTRWNPDNWQSDAYRRCCTSRAWIGTAIAAKLMKLEPFWGHDAFFDYVDRWMTEDETEAVAVMAALGRPQAEWARQGQVEIRFHEAMWRAYRGTVEPDFNAWRQRAPEARPWHVPGGDLPAPPGERPNLPARRTDRDADGD